MSWHRRSLSTLITRVVAIALVIGWTVVPGLCVGSLEIAHANVVADNHGRTESHPDTHHDDPFSCCRSLAEAKFMTATPVEVTPPEIILIAVIHTVERASAETAIAFEPIEAATGPPRTRSTRLFSYSPLAPPSRIA